MGGSSDRLPRPNMPISATWVPVGWRPRHVWFSCVISSLPARIPCRSHSGVGGERIEQQTLKHTHSCVTGLAAAGSSTFSASAPSVDHIDQVLYIRFQHSVIVSSLQPLLPVSVSIELHLLPIPGLPRPFATRYRYVLLCHHP